MWNSYRNTHHASERSGKTLLQHLLAYLQEAPNLARYFGVGLDVDGRPDEEDAARASRSRVMVMIRLDE